MGHRAGYGLRTGIGNVYIGEQEMARHPNESYHTYIHNINTTSVSGGFADTVTVDLSTRLTLAISLPHDGTRKTSRRCRMPAKRLYRFQPVTYRYKKEKNSTAIRLPITA